MEFKPWYYLQEVIDTKDEFRIKAQLQRMGYDANTQELIDQYLKRHRDDPTLYSLQVLMKDIDLKFPKKNSEEANLVNLKKEFQRRENLKGEMIQALDFFSQRKVPIRSLQKMMELLRTLSRKKLVDVEFKNNRPILLKKNDLGVFEEVPSHDFESFMQSLNSVQTQIVRTPNTHFDAQNDLDQDEHLVAKGDNIWVFKGGTPELCKKYGQGTIWCISSSNYVKHYFDYRGKNQTRYFVFDLNKSYDDPARYVTGAVTDERGSRSDDEWVDARNYQNQINGYPNVKKYLDYLADKGIPRTTWKNDPLAPWEKRLNDYLYSAYKYNSTDRLIELAKNDPNKNVFTYFLKTAHLTDKQFFDELNNEERKIYMKGRLDYDEKKLAWTLENMKREFIESLPYESRFQIAYLTNDRELLNKISGKLNWDSLFLFFPRDAHDEIGIYASKNLKKGIEFLAPDYSKNLGPNVLKKAIHTILYEIEIYNNFEDYKQSLEILLTADNLIKIDKNYLKEIVKEQPQILNLKAFH